MKMVTKVFSCILVICMLTSLAACGGGSGGLSGGNASNNPNVTTMDGGGAAGTSSTGYGIGAQDQSKVDVAWDDLSSMDKVYRLMDQYPLMFNGFGPQQYADRSGVNKGLGNIQKKDKYVLGHSGNAMNSPYFINLIEGTTAQAEAYGFEVITQLTGGNTEMRYQQIDSFITQGVDGLMINGDPSSDEPYFRRCAEAGIPVVVASAQMMMADNPVVTNLLCSGFVAGFFVGEYLAEYMVKLPQFSANDYIFQFGHATFSLSFGDSQSRNCGTYAGFLYYLAKYDGKPYPDKWSAIVDGATIWVKVIDEGKYNVANDKNTKWLFEGGEAPRINIRGYGMGTPDSPGGQQAVQDLIVAHPDIDICLFDTDTMFPGGEVVLNQNGKYPGKNIWVAAAADGTPYGMEKIKNGEIVAIGNNSSLMNAYGMATVMRDIYMGGKANEMNNAIPNTYTPTVAITIENVDDYYDPNMTIAKGIPFEVETIDEYNARMKIALEKNDPFYYPGFWISNEEWKKN